MPVRVLIADPDKYLRASYQEGLSRLGYHVETAGDGLECLDRLCRSHPDVLVLDPAIPWGGGDGVLTLMHEEPEVPSTPAIVLTAGNDRGLLYRLAQFYVHCYHIKPVSVRRVAQLIEAVCPGGDSRRRLSCVVTESKAVGSSSPSASPR